jgi:hypothetical protein
MQQILVRVIECTIHKWVTLPGKIETVRRSVIACSSL